MTSKHQIAGTNALLTGIDGAIEAHLAWNQKLFRCALLRESPGDDMLRPDANTLCKFGVWFSAHTPALGEYDAELVAKIFAAHLEMHQAVSAMCRCVLAGAAAFENDLFTYGKSQNQMVHMLNELRQRIVDLAEHHDVLTGLPLRHGLDHAFDIRRKDSHRSGQSLWLVMIDVDLFKSVNDTYGHSVGDIALRHIAQVLSGTLRDNDILIRFGGEEFLALFPISDAEGITFVAQRLMDAMHDQPLRTEDGIVIALTATMGWAKVQPGEELSSVIARADHALMYGKTHGRDQYVMATD